MNDQTIKTVNHWGKWVSSDKPVTGVVSSNNIAWEYIDDEICLTCEQAWKEIEQDDSMDEDEKQDEYDNFMCDSSHEKIIGNAWLLDTKTSKYSVITDNPELEFAAIVNETTIQVVWSKYTKRGALCSPCYPGQVDLDSDGEFLGYTLPAYLLGDDSE